jgi:dipeptidyl aminopeptidase/acylaminoacyl peptidase
VAKGCLGAATSGLVAGWHADCAVIDGLGGYNSDVALVSLDGSRVVRLTYTAGCSGNLTWSPDGKQIAGTFRVSPQETERSGILVINADGSDKERYGHWLIDVSPQGPRLGGAQRHGLMSYYSHGSARPRRVMKTFTSLAWSPDGKTLAFSSDMSPTGAFYLYTISPDGGEPHRLDATISAWPNEIMWRPAPSE